MKVDLWGLVLPALVVLFVVAVVLWGSQDAPPDLSGGYIDDPGLGYLYESYNP